LEVANVSTREVQTAFLTNGPAFRFLLPEEFDAVPELSTPIFNGVGSRSFVFTPRPHDAQLPNGGRHLRTLTSMDGRTVEVYERLAKPLVWWLRWPLSNGSLTTHLVEEDGLSRSKVVAESVSISETTSGGAPFVLVSRPLAVSASGRPGFQELVTFFSTRPSWSVTLARPAFLSQGVVAELPRNGADSGTWLRGGTQFGLEVQVTSTAEAAGRAVLDLVLTSLTEA